MPRSTRVALATTALLLLSACGSGATLESADEPDTRAHPIRIVAEAINATDGDPGLDPDQIRSGGPGVDGIPAIDEPVIIDGDEAARSLVDSEQVMLVAWQGEARAYPLRSLVRHEIANDVVGGRAIAVTWCPLCNTGVAYDRTLDGEVTTFGVTGTLFQSAMVMYDRATRSLWTQPTGEAVLGQRTGTVLEVVPAGLVPWAEARRTHPDVTVALADRSELDSATNPYEGYDTSRSPFLFDGVIDERLPPFERVAGVSFGGEPTAYAFSLLERERVVAETVGGQPIVVLWAPGSASPLDTRDLTAGRDVGASGVFDPRIEGRELTFEPVDAGEFRDRETGSTWTLGGLATAGPLAGQRLTRLPSQDAFWFAWSAFTPGTVLRS